MTSAFVAVAPLMHADIWKQAICVARANDTVALAIRGETLAFDAKTSVKGARRRD
jgi:hypothetical protein